MTTIRRDCKTLLILGNTDDAVTWLNGTGINRSSEYDPNRRLFHVQFTQLTAIHILHRTLRRIAFFAT